MRVKILGGQEINIKAIGNALMWIYGFITRRNLLAVLVAVELILNSGEINFR